MEGSSLPAAGPTQPGGQAASAANPAQSVTGIPTDLSELTQLVVTLRKRWVQVAAARGARGEQLTPEQLAGLEEFFRLAGAVTMSPGLRAATRLDAAMEAVLKPGYKFPEPFKTQARELLDAWTASHWGGSPPGEPAEEGGEGQQGEGPEGQQAGGQQAEGAQPTEAAQPTAPAQHTAPQQVRRPDPTHRIYGTNGIMRGILVTRGQRGRVYIFDPAYQLRPAAVFGHNGLAVGQWWPLQKAAMRDGAHGSAQAGIHGRADDGAYSVVVSGGPVCRPRRRRGQSDPLLGVRVSWTPRPNAKNNAGHFHAAEVARDRPTSTCSPSGLEFPVRACRRHPLRRPIHNCIASHPA